MTLQRSHGYDVHALRRRRRKYDGHALGGTRSRRLCGPCADGRHTEQHSDTMGCTRAVAAEPRDFICTCLHGAA